MVQDLLQHTFLTMHTQLSIVAVHLPLHSLQSGESIRLATGLVASVPGEAASTDRAGLEKERESDSEGTPMS